MRTFKQHFTMSFNGRREHSGTMFEGRYHERNHPAEGPAMWRTSAYIDINAWEAGMAERPEGYRWCSFAAAVRGDRKARAGYLHPGPKGYEIWANEVRPFFRRFCGK